ncbi:MAG TPA: sugar phosphate isomerase/epimerase family protein [Bryobacteraceae bacterium]|jgi:sugar phosphate isomerase/epimerase|nr:sugar phosphate isomerase/epimerase family protein [Bryobacteraceae bacterium]
MARLTRRTIFRSAAAAAAGRWLRADTGRLRIGVTDWNLRLIANPEAVALAARLGFDGVQVSFGRRIADGKMPGDNPELIARYLQASAEHKLPIDGTCVDMLHTNGLKSDPLAVKWVRDAIRLTQALHTGVLLLPFFGKWAIQTPAEREAVAGRVRELAPEAEKAGVILGLENTISAEDNARILDRVRSKNVLVYYDVGNSTNNGFDVVKEIRWLGKDRICQIHLKDNPHYMGEGKIDFPAVLRAIHDIGFTGYANLETDVHQGSTVETDMRRNLEFTRKTLAAV